MKKFAIIIFPFLISLSSFCTTEDGGKIKYRKLAYQDFSRLSINDTSMAVIDLFFRKKESAVYEQMSLLPLSLGLTVIPQTRIVGAGTMIISLPLFINGCSILVRYRKKRLYQVLEKYKSTKELPSWVRKKVNKLMNDYDTLPMEY